MDKSIEAAARALNYELYGDDATEAALENTRLIVRAAITAYRDAEIERLTAELARVWLLCDTAELHRANAERQNYDLRAKLEADAERYRFLKGNFGICRPFDELLIWHPDEIDDAIDTAMRNDDAARGGERG